MFCAVVHSIGASSARWENEGRGTYSHCWYTCTILTLLLFLSVWSYICLSVCLYYVQSLSRLTQVVPGVFLAVIDTCGPAAILEGVGVSGARVQQHLLTAMATALVSSRIQTHRITQNRVCVFSHTYIQITYQLTQETQYVQTTLLF